MATIPSGGIANVRVEELRWQAETQSPFTGKRYVDDLGVKKYRVHVTTRPYKMGDAAIQDWLDFFEDCEGAVDTFTMNLSSYLPGVAGASSMTLRMEGTPLPFDYPKNRITQFSFRARQE